MISPRAVSSDADKRVRQQERTVDNLNRLFAMLFSIVFSMAAAAETGKIISFADKAINAKVVFDFQTTFFNAGALATLALTSAVFFHQASRGLDLAYSSISLEKPKAGALALDFGVITATMLPFVLMARSLDSAVTQKIGFLMFFIAHESLIVFGVIWIFVMFFRLEYYPAQSVSQPFRGVLIGVQRFWFCMNSLYLWAVAALFALLSGSFGASTSCPLIPNKGSSLKFMVGFFVFAFARNWIDYYSLFRVFFPVKPNGADGAVEYSPVLRWCMREEGSWVFGLAWPTVLGSIFFIGSAAIIVFVTNLFDLAKWAHVCGMGV